MMMKGTIYGEVSTTIYRKPDGVMYTPIDAARTPYREKVIRMMLRCVVGPRPEQTHVPHRLPVLTLLPTKLPPAKPARSRAQPTFVVGNPSAHGLHVFPTPITLQHCDPPYTHECIHNSRALLLALHSPRYHCPDPDLLTPAHAASCSANVF